jgi:DNA damage-binding protein 1
LTEESPINDYSKSIVFGGTDGVITSFSVISATIGAGYTYQTVFVIGFSVIISGSIALGINEFLSSKAHKEFVQAEKRRGQWEFKHDRANQVKDMVKLFEYRGMSKPDAETVVNKMAQYEGFFVNQMVTEELGLQPPEDDDFTLLVDAFVMIFSYALLGSIPILIFLSPLYLPSLSTRDLFTTSAVLTGLILYILGSVKSTFRYPIFSHHIYIHIYI